MRDMSTTTAVVLRSDGVNKPVFLGSAFAFRKKTHFLTAAHCIGDLAHSSVYLGSPALNAGHATPVVSITRHPKADVAVLEVAAEGTYRVDPSFILARNFGYGSDVCALGFSEETTEENTVKPMARVFRGSLQRFFPHTGQFKHQYAAGELSFPAPAGLSGGPVLMMPQAIHLVGIVAENFESTTYLHSWEEIQEDGTRHSERVHRVIQYGVFVQLEPLEPWLNRAVGPEF